MMTADERVCHGLKPFYVQVPSTIGRHLSMNAPQFCCDCGEAGSWETAVIDPARRNRLLCPFCHDVLMYTCDSFYDMTMDGWRMAQAWEGELWRDQRIPVSRGIVHDFLRARGWR